jgi:hypothetical protein
MLRQHLRKISLQLLLNLLLIHKLQPLRQLQPM